MADITVDTSGWSNNYDDEFYRMMAMQASGGFVKAGGSYGAAASQKGLLESEATIAEYQAKQALVVGEAQEQSSDLRTGALFGQQRANMAANGVRLGSGSALDVLASTRYLGARDAATIHDNAARTAWSYNTQAQIDRFAASGINPGLTAASSLLGSAGSVASSWYRYQAGA